jgi:hypothetical protein
LAIVVANCSNFNDHVWPAQRNDGSAGTNFVVKEGQIYRLKHDSATNTAIAAMPHPTGKALAQASQTYGMLVIDNNGNFGNLFTLEDHTQFVVLNGFDAYGRNAAGNTNDGINNGQTFQINTMAGFPWGHLELLDHTKINPADASQPIQSAPTGISGLNHGSNIALTWPDNAAVSFWNVYQKTAPSTYVLIATTNWPQYTAWYPPASMTFAITAVNGGGESSRSVDFTPPSLPRSRRRVRSTIG